MSITRWHSLAPLLAGALTGALALTACSGPPPGPMQSETRSVEAFHAIELRGNGEALIRVGGTQQVSVTTQQSALPRVKTRVENGVLIVENVHGWWGTRPALRLQVDLPALDSVITNGAGIIAIENVSGPRLSLVVAGAGTIKASGEISAMDASLNGAGKLELSGLKAGDASVTVNGTGNIEVQVAGQLEATVNGVGSITYAGNPREVVQHVNGVGNISPAGKQSP